MERIVGIDLGTTNSLVGYLDGETPRVVADPTSGRVLLPSVVAFEPAGAVVVGDEALARAVTTPETTIQSVKRFMGLGPEHVSAADNAMRASHRCTDGPLMVHLSAREARGLE